MIKNYILTAWRNIYRNKLFSFINVFGLSISMAVCLLVIMIITEQYRTDQHNPNKDQVFRITSHYQLLDRSNSLASAPLPLAEAIGDELSSVDAIMTLRTGAGGRANTGSKIISLEGFYVSPEIFPMMDVHLALGDERTALGEPFKMVLSHDAAIKLYGHTNVVSETISVEGKGDYTISGVLEKTDNKSHIDGYEMLVSMSTYPLLEEKDAERPAMDNWNAFYVSYVYLHLDEKASKSDLEAYLNNIAQSRYADQENFTMQFKLQQLTDISPFTEELGNQLYFAVPLLVLVVLAGLALVIMFSATFNYTNLTIARALTRAREIGVRKVSGANRFQVFAQFIIESVVASMIALVFALVLLQFLIPAFYGLDEHVKQVFGLKSTPDQWIYFVVFSLFVGVIGGLSPALYLSRFNPTVVLKSFAGIKLFSKVNARKVLIVAQFTLCMIFIITASLMNKQFRFALNYDLGFDREQIVNVELGDHEYETVANELRKIPGVQMVSGARYVMGIGSLWAEYMRNPEHTDSMTVAFLTVSPEYLRNFKHELVAGSDFPQEVNSENEEFVIINEEAVKELELGSPDEAIGNRIVTETGEPQVIGVVKNFHYQTLEQPIGAFAFKLLPQYDVANVRIAGDPGVVLMEMEKAWKTIDSALPFEYRFYDEQIEDAYMQYMLLTKMVGFFAFLAISIACVGLLGMAVYTSELRQKEVGIRKVLGANVPRLVFTLSRGFIVLMLIATVIAVPVSYVLNDQILSQAAYRTSIDAFTLGKGALFMLGIGFLIICSQTLKTALSSPVDTLRNE